MSTLVPSDMAETPGLDALRIVLRVLSPRAHALTTADSDLLRRRLCAAVDELKHYGLPAERVVIVVKQLATDAGFGQHTEEPLRKMISWCIEEYYSFLARTTPPEPA